MVYTLEVNLDSLTSISGMDLNKHSITKKIVDLGKTPIISMVGTLDFSGY